MARRHQRIIGVVMSFTDEIRTVFDGWMRSVANAVETAADRILRPRHILLEEQEDGGFTARLTSPGRAMLPSAGPGLSETSFTLTRESPTPVLSAEWVAAFRGSRIEIALRPDRAMYGPLDFPAQAEPFLDGMIRAQIDRLTPWTADNAVFGWNGPTTITPERVGVTFAAMARSATDPVVQLARSFDAASVTLLTTVMGEDGSQQEIRLLDRSLHSAIGKSVNVPRILRFALLGTAMMACVAALADTYLADRFQSEQQDLLRQVSQRRAALHLGGGADQSGFGLLARRKQTTPSVVMVLESLSHVLPDTTYVTELRIEGDKVQVVGMTQDAPSLVRLMEQSPQFTRATFFAPTTRAPNEGGEQFHIEAHITPYFGSGT